MRYQYLILFSFLFLNTSFITAQKFLQIEKVGSFKVEKFYIGDEITFQSMDEKNLWRTEVIKDLILDEDILVFNKGMLKMKDIYKIRTFHGASGAKKIAYSLYSFGAGWVLFSLVDAVFGGTLTWGVAIVSGTAFATGWLIKKIFSTRTYKIGNRRRLRILDLTFKKPQYHP
ncbi:MAG TPA: hypothetical protein ENI82_04130 [Bacteroidetes bacterium]|nr:hypothetical protein [Bacteroidota bacterium]